MKIPLLRNTCYKVPFFPFAKIKLGGWGWHQIIKIEENIISKGGFEKFFKFYRPNFIKIGTLVQEVQHFFEKIATFLQIFSKSEFFGFYGDMSHILYTFRDQNHKDLSGALFSFKFGSSRTQWWSSKRASLSQCREV